MKREIKTYGGHFEAFFEKLDSKAKAKFVYAFDQLRTQTVISEKFVKHLRDGLYELRVSWMSNAYRVFFIFDQGQIVVLFNGFQKKTQKTPDKELTKALKIKAEYYADRERK